MVKKVHGLDFTLDKYRELCKALEASGYRTVTLSEYFLGDSLPERFVILRHDIDRKPGNACNTAAIEHELGMRSTYYFRAKKAVFKPDIMHSVAGMGHEIGYHYETLSDTKGDYDKALELFRKNLELFRGVADIKTICMHGAPLSPYDNRDLWKRYELKDFGLLGEAYLSMGKGLCYFSDTGRTWDMGRKIRDRLPSGIEMKADTTDSLIKIVVSGHANRLYILTHPERWSANDAEWAVNYAKDSIFTLGKKSVSMISSR